MPQFRCPKCNHSVVVRFNHEELTKEAKCSYCGALLEAGRHSFNEPQYPYLLGLAVAAYAAGRKKGKHENRMGV